MTAIVSPDPILDPLNEPQREAVTWGDGALLILAGPGSGKTRVITHRVAYLVERRKIFPWRTLAVTFTNKAAREMRERAHGLLGDEARELHMGTFHAMCARWLRADGESIGVGRNFNIYDDADQVAVMKRVLEGMSVDIRAFSPRGVLSAVSRAKNELVSPAQLRERSSSYADEVVARAAIAYQSALRESNALDFDDLLIEGLRMFRESPEARQKYAERYIHVLVDEFQDTNPVQYRLAREVASVHGNITAVGDPDQGIYSWRAADSRNVDFFRRDYPDAHVVLLEQNYRSTSAILTAADAVIAKNPGRTPRTLWTERSDGDLVVSYEAYNDDEEGEFIAREASRLVATGRSLSDIAVLFRTNSQSRPVEDALIRHRIPYRLIGGVRFYQRREVKDAMAYLRLIHNRYDEASWTRIVNVPARGIGARSVEHLRAWAGAYGLRIQDACEALVRGEPIPGITPKSGASIRQFTDMMKSLRAPRSGPLPALLDEVMEATGYREYIRTGDEGAQERLENLDQLRNVMAQYEEAGDGVGDLATFLQDVALVADVDELEDTSGAVTLLTIHSAKGLEFPIVFMAGMEEGVLPHIRSFDDPSAMEEERRLAYVGMTRAGDQLYLLRAFRRMAFGVPQANPASRFLVDLPPGVIRPFSSTSAPTYADAVAVPSSRTGNGQFKPLEAAWSAGDRVRHPKFGTGTVVAVQERSGDVELSVVFDEAGLKRLAQSLAPLSAAT